MATRWFNSGIVVAMLLVLFHSVCVTAQAVSTNQDVSVGKIEITQSGDDSPVISVVPMKSVLAQTVLSKSRSLDSMLGPEDDYAYLVNFNFAAFQKSQPGVKFSSELSTNKFKLKLSFKKRKQDEKKATQVFDVSSQASGSGIFVVRNENAIVGDRIENIQTVSGRFADDSGVYFVKPLSDGVHLWTKRKLEPPQTHDQGDDIRKWMREYEQKIQNSDKKKQFKKKAALEDPNTDLKVAIFFTCQSANLAGDMKVLSERLIAELNQAFECSNVDKTAILAHWGCVNPECDETKLSILQTFVYFVESGEINKIRSCTEADYCFLVSAKNFGGYGFRLKGSHDPATFSQLAFGIGSLNQVESNFTFNHEIGHVFGCCHSTSCSDPLYDYGYPKIFNWDGTTVQRKTIMYSGGTTSAGGLIERMNFFSANDVKVSKSSYPPCFWDSSGTPIGEAKKTAHVRFGNQ